MKCSFSKKLLWLGCALCGCFASAFLLAAGDAQAQQPPADKPAVAIIPGRSDQVSPLADLLFAELSKSQRMNQRTSVRGASRGFLARPLEFINSFVFEV